MLNYEIVRCPNSECRSAGVNMSVLHGSDRFQLREYFVECDKCHMQGPECNSGAEAIVLWNKLPRVAAA